MTVAWRTPYESVGAKVSGEGDKTTGGGLAWGGGCSPTLTPNLVMFTDNQDPVNLLALDMKTGEVVASCPVLDDLPEGYQVAVENSAIVYDDGEGVVSTIVCNWFGAGSGAGRPEQRLFHPELRQHLRHELAHARQCYDRAGRRARGYREDRRRL